VRGRHFVVVCVCAASVCIHIAGSLLVCTHSTSSRLATVAARAARLA
jgi:hypothetical protein